MEKFFMALSSATPASCISNLWETPRTGMSSLQIDQFLDTSVLTAIRATRWRGPDLPVRGGDGVIDGRLEGSKILQAIGSHVWEQEPVSNAELGEQAALHHMVQLVQGWTPQAAGIHHLLSTQHMLNRRGEKKERCYWLDCLTAVN